LAEETEVFGENLPQCRSAHHKPHMLPGREHPNSFLLNQLRLSSQETPLILIQLTLDPRYMDSMNGPMFRYMSSNAVVCSVRLETVYPVTGTLNLKVKLLLVLRAQLA
jgi:hypothetical protein